MLFYYECTCALISCVHRLLTQSSSAPGLVSARSTERARPERVSLSGPSFPAFMADTRSQSLDAAASSSPTCVRSPSLLSLPADTYATQSSVKSRKRSTSCSTSSPSARRERERDPCTHSETKTSSSFDSMLQCTSSQTAVEKLDSIRHRLLRCSPDCRIAKSSRPDLVWRIRRACGTLRSRGLLSRVADARRRPRPLRAGSLHADEGRQINARHR